MMTLKMTQGKGSCQIPEIWKMLAKILVLVARDHQITLQLIKVQLHINLETGVRFFMKF
jgi:hypothetical protein